MPATLSEKEIALNLRAETLLLDGQAAARTYAPASEADAAEVICEARAEGMALVPWGGGSRVHSGNPLRAPRWAALTTASLAGEIEFSPADMVVTAGAGVTLARLQERLRAEGQYLPLDPPGDSSSTVAGMVAANAAGLWRPAFGTPRDRLLGFRAVLANGDAIKGGGKVVKNVAGYDLCKLFCGSRGTLGFITEVTFKTNPLPERRLVRTYGGGSTSALLEAALRIHTERLDPLYLTAAAPENVLYVGYTGSPESVTWQAGAVDLLLESSGLRATAEWTDDMAARSACFPSGQVEFRIAARPSELPALADALVRSLEPHSAAAVFHLPTGLAEIALALAPAEPATLIGAVTRALPEGAHLAWMRVPPGWYDTTGDVWGRLPQGFALMRGIKEALDPEGVFSAGRSIGRL